MEHQHDTAKYTCPMHPQIMQDKPGNCPICGMTLVLANTSAKHDNDMHHHHGANPAMGHEGHDHGKMIEDFRKRFYVVLVLTIPIMLLSTMIQHFMGVNWQFHRLSIHFVCTVNDCFSLRWLAIFKRYGR